MSYGNQDTDIDTVCLSSSMSLIACVDVIKTLNSPYLVLPFMAKPPLPHISPNSQEPLTCSPSLQFLDPYLLKSSFGRAKCLDLPSLLRLPLCSFFCEPRQLLYSPLGSSLPTRGWGGLSINGWKVIGPQAPQQGEIFAQYFKVPSLGLPSQHCPSALWFVAPN